MRVDANFYGTVPMDDAGRDGPLPVDRRYGNDDYLACYENLRTWARTMDRLGYDTMWLTEHHFQHEGYEVTPNLVLFGLHLTSITEQLRLGQMFNIVPQWHPLRLAEDVAMAQILSGDRMVFGVGRGTVPREAQTLGGVVASGDNEMSVELDRLNREMFEEAMEVIKAAWYNERFSFSGKHFTFPPTGIPDRGSVVKDLTLVPKPIAPLPVWQAVTSPPTLDYCARVGHHAVMPARGIEATRQWWDRFAEKATESGWELAPGEGRCLQINCHLGPTHDDAVRTGRDPHDEFIRFLAPYGRFRHYPTADGSTPPFDYEPPLEESIRNEIMLIGSVDEVVDLLGRYREALSAKHVVLFFDMPGIGRAEMDDQLSMFAEEVAPQLGIDMSGPMSGSV